MQPNDRALPAYLRHRIERWLADDKRRTASELAALAHVTPTHISTIRSGQRGVGMKVVRGLAAAFDTTIGRLEDEAAAWARENPQAVAAPAAEPTDPFPARATALAAASTLGYAPELIAHVRAMSMLGAENFDADDWLDVLRTERKRGGRATEPVSQSAKDATKQQMPWAKGEPRGK